MRKVLIQIALLFLISNLKGQNFQISERLVEFELPSNPYEFHHLDKKLDSLKSMKIAIVKCVFANNKKTSLANVYYSLRIFSNKLSANSYRIDKKELNIDNDSSSIVFSIYYTLPDYLEENFSLYPKNVIYVIGHLSFKKESLQKVKINKRIVYLASLDFVERKISGNETVKINYGGILGATWKIKGEEKRAPAFLSTGGISVRPSSTSYSQVGVEISTGKLVAVEPDLGWFLINTLHKVR